jgi:stage II sporulation protein M
MKMKNKKFNFKNQYEKSWKHIKESKNFIYFSILIFLVFSLIGFFFPAPESLQTTIFEFLEKLIQLTSEMSPSELIIYIFFNNLQSSFFGMVFGFILGIFPLISLVANGYLLGFVSALSVNAEGFSILWRLIPHGIFELPALFVSLGLGLRIGSFILKKNKWKFLKLYFIESLRVFLFVVLPLLLIAALIEGSLMFLL